MLLFSLILIPFFGAASIPLLHRSFGLKIIKSLTLMVATIELIYSLMIWLLYDNSCKNFQFVQDKVSIGHFDIYLGIDGLSIYFVLLTTLIMPLAIISNWKSIKENTLYFLIIMLMAESLLLLIFLVLDVLMFYVFFESILAPLFILIGIFGSSEKIRASFYFFLYTFFGSVFMLLAVVGILEWIGTTDYDLLTKNAFFFSTQIFMFIGILIAFAVKTPVIYLNSWLLKAHVESPLSGSIILAAIILKLSLYGIFRLILPILPKAFITYTYVIFLIGVLTIIYASLSTLRTIDIKELIAYSSVSHAAVYLAGAVCNIILGILGCILLGIAHGFVSSGLFTSAGGVLYDRAATRLITFYKGMAQPMPIFAILFFILCLGNCGAPLTINFIGEFMSLYGVFERITLAGVFASSSIVFSAAFTIYMYNRIALGGYFSKNWTSYVPDINKREFSLLLILVVFTVILGIYPSIITDGLNYSLYFLIFSFDGIHSSNEIILFASEDNAMHAISTAISTPITNTCTSTCICVPDVNNLVGDDVTNTIASNVPKGFKDGNQSWMFHKIVGRPSGTTGAFHSFLNWSTDNYGAAQRVEFSRIVDIEPNGSRPGCPLNGTSGSLDIQALAVKVRVDQLPDDVAPSLSELSNNNR